MKQMLNLNALAQELTRQHHQKRDFVASTQAMKVDFTAGDSKCLNIDGGVEESFELTEHAHRQLGARLKIPWRFYERMLEDHPDILERDLNALMHREPEERMVRTLDGKARAIVSNRYRRLDNYPLVENVLPVLMEQELDLEQSSFAVTDSRLFMKLVFPRVQSEVKVDDIVQSGLIISNSEVGAGVLRITPLVFRLVCLNGMVAPKSVDHFQRTHLGKELSVDGLAGQLYRRETLETADRALWMEVQDLTRATVDPANFGTLVDRMRATTERRIEGNPIKAVEVLAKQHTLTEEERGGILSHLIQGGDLSQYGLLNAVTRFAQDVSSYERSTELEELGGQILDLHPSQWTVIAKAA